jgi:porin
VAYISERVQWVIGAYDTEGVPNRAGFDTAFKGGTTFATEARFSWQPFGRSGHQLFGFIWSDKEFDALEQDPRVGLDKPEGVIGRLRGLAGAFGSESGSWAFYYNFDQYVYQEPGDPTQGVGIFGRFGISDGDANPIEAFYSLGIGGKGIFPERDEDRFGVGYFYTDYSDTDLTHFLEANSAQGVEMFYNFEVTPWMHITPDLQILIDAGGVDDRDVAVVCGLRMHMSF